MSWGRMDDGWDDSDSVVSLLGEDDPLYAGAAAGLWSLCFAWANRNTRKRGKTPGLVPAGLPRRYLGAVGNECAALLVKHGLWQLADEGGWLIVGFEDTLPTEETREARSEAGKRGAAKRWAGHRKVEKVKPKADDGNLPSACHGADSKPDGNAMANDGSRAPARWATPNGVAPTPEPIPVQPSAAETAALAALGALGPDAAITRQSKVITDAYHSAQPMCNWPAVNGVVLKAFKSRKYAAPDILAAMLRLADDGRPVTVDALRIEIEGLPPIGGSRGRASPGNGLARRDGPPPLSTADERFAQAMALANKYAEEDR